MRGLAVVQAVADARDLKELCARIGVARSTTHRLASCLVQERYLRVLPGVGYALGPKLIELGFQAREAFPLATWRASVPGRPSRADRRHHPSGGARQRRSAVPGKDSRQEGPGDALARRPPHAAGGHGRGKALLDADEPQWKALHRVGGPVSSRAPAGSRAGRRSANACAAMRRRAMPSTWKTTSRRSAAWRRAVRDASSGIVAAISVSSTVPYMSLERMDEMVPVVCDAAMRISAELGWIIPAAASARPGRPDAS